MAKSKSPSARSAEVFRGQGYIVEQCERWIPYTNRRVDFGNFADQIIFRPGGPIVAVQVTSGSNHAARRTKILAEPKARLWLEAGGRIFIHSWAKRCKVGPDGKRQAVKTWQVREVEITLADYEIKGAE